MFARILTCALLSGSCAGLIAGLLQWYFVQPVLLQAELYETGTLVHYGKDTSPVQMIVRQIDWIRDGLSLVFSMVIYVAYALVMLAFVALFKSQARLTASQGLLLGLAGFAIVMVAPAFGLPPEIPGVAAVDVYTRQIWWFGTVLATLIGVGLMLQKRIVLLKPLAIAFFLIPHVIGAPHPDFFAGTAPPEVAAMFVVRVLGVGLVAWLSLGLLAAYFWDLDDA